MTIYGYARVNTAGRRLQVGGTVGALLLVWWLQRARWLAVAVLFLIAVPIVGSIGNAGLTSATALLTATFFAGAVVLSIQAGINGLGAMLYPTILRANGSGWQPASAGSAALSGRCLGRCLGTGEIYVSSRNSHDCECAFDCRFLLCNGPTTPNGQAARPSPRNAFDRKDRHP